MTYTVVLSPMARDTHAKQVTILGVFHGGQDYESALEPAIS